MSPPLVQPFIGFPSHQNKPLQAHVIWSCQSQTPLPSLLAGHTGLLAVPGISLFCSCLGVFASVVCSAWSVLPSGICMASFPPLSSPSSFKIVLHPHHIPSSLTPFPFLFPIRISFPDVYHIYYIILHYIILYIICVLSVPPVTRMKPPWGQTLWLSYLSQYNQCLEQCLALSGWSTNIFWVSEIQKAPYLCGYGLTQHMLCT